MTAYNQQTALTQFFDTFQQINSLNEISKFFDSLSFPNKQELELKMVKSIKDMFTAEINSIIADSQNRRCFSLSNFGLSIIPQSIFANILSYLSFVQVTQLLRTNKFFQSQSPFLTIFQTHPFHFLDTIISQKKHIFNAPSVNLMFSKTCGDYTYLSRCLDDSEIMLVPCKTLTNCSSEHQSQILSFCSLFESVPYLCVPNGSAFEKDTGSMLKNLVLKAKRIDTFSIGLSSLKEHCGINDQDVFHASRIDGVAEEVGEICIDTFPNIREIRIVDRELTQDNIFEEMQDVPHESIRNQLTKLIHNFIEDLNMEDFLRYSIYVIGWCENVQELCFNVYNADDDEDIDIHVPVFEDEK